MTTVLASALTGLAVAWTAARVGTRRTTDRRGRRIGGGPAAAGRSPARWDRMRRVVAAIGTAGAAFLLVEAWLGLWTVALPPAVLAGAIPGALAARGRRTDRRAIREAWPDALRDLVASLRAGQTIEGAMRALARSGPVPLRPRLDGFEDRVGAIGLVPALEELAATLDDATSDRVVEVLVVAAERGGSVVPELLAHLAGSLTKDAWMEEEIETASLEHRINAWAVFALPWAVLGFLTARPGPFRDFYGSAGGAVVVLAGGVAGAGGLAWVLALGRTAVEPRVFRRTDR